MLELKRTYHKTVLDSAHASFFSPPTLLLINCIWTVSFPCRLICACPHGYIDAISWKAIEQWDLVATIKQTLHYGSSDNKYIV